MKKLSAIVFLSVILLNLCGYRLIVACIQSSNDVYIENMVSHNQYKESDLVSIRTKMNLPYYSGSDEYERAYGSVTVKGITYQLVKRRMRHDTLEMLCIINQTKTRLQSFSSEIEKSLADNQTSTPRKNITIKITFPYFVQSFWMTTANCFSQERVNFIDHDEKLPEGHSLLQKKPPRSFQIIS